ncbi:MAG: UDP-N-acetylmuramoyl-tripeptide--D-alanyl-D-alanine ligase [Vulcanimicrobiaceae bacterium]
MSVATRLALPAMDARVAAGEPPSELRISTDSRTVLPGETFLALRGERFDGHAFVAAAIARGAVAAIVEDAGVVPAGAAAIVVRNATAAFLACASVARRAADVRVVAVTGSTGKTTTKELTAQLAEWVGLGPVAATPANENNEIGVAKLFVGLPAGTRSVVVELGARHAGEIAPLAAVARPDVAVLTNIGDAHLEIMGSRDALIATKWGIFTAAPDAAGQPRAVLNAGDRTARMRAPDLLRPPMWFATDSEQLTGLPPDDEFVLIETARALVRRAGDERAISIRMTLPGAHNRANLAAAVAAIVALGVDPERIAAAIPGLHLPPGRYERRRLADIDVVFDAYNASMDGTLATLRSFAQEPAGRRIAVLGSMAELGSEAPSMHRRVGAEAARLDLDVVLVGGDFADELARGALDYGLARHRVVHYAGNAEAAGWLRANGRAGDLVLLKGSRKYRLEEILDALRTAHA